MSQTSRRRHIMGEPRRGKPGWLKMPTRTGENYFELQRLVRAHGLSTICEEARCPNIGECWNARTATFLILGHQCTRRCTFCDVGYAWTGKVDTDEGRRLADAVAELGLDHVVITSVDRDDLTDGGAAVFVDVVERLQAQTQRPKIELLIPDFQGKDGALDAVLAAGAEVVAHNLETVRGLYPGVRPRGNYDGSLEVLSRIASWTPPPTSPPNPRPVVKTGIMLGLGETDREIDELFADAVAVGVELMTVGQYLQPSKAHHRVERFYRPEEFDAIAERGRRAGLAHVESGPFVRSSYHAADQNRVVREAVRSAGH